MLEAAALWSVVLGAVVLGAAVLLDAAAFWSAGAVVAGAVVLEAAALWLVELGVCAGGFTGALALSEDAPAGLLVVAAGAFALLVSVVGVWELPDVTGVLLLAEVEGEAALWSLAEAGAEALEALEAGAAAFDAEASAAEVPGAAPSAAWLLVQESEIMLTELTCNEPSLARVPWT